MALKFILLIQKAKGQKILGEEVFEKITDIKDQVDIVDVFRPSKEVPAIAEDTLKIGAKVLWLQLGIRSEEAKKINETLIILITLKINVLKWNIKLIFLKLDKRFQLYKINLVFSYDPSSMIKVINIFLY